MILSLTLAAQAATLPEVPTLPALSTEEGALVRGIVVAAAAEPSWIGLSTRYTIVVDEVLIGEAPTEVEITLPGGTAAGLTQVVAGVPTWEPGDEAVLFLESDLSPTPWGAFTLFEGRIVDPLARPVPATLDGLVNRVRTGEVTRTRPSP